MITNLLITAYCSCSICCGKFNSAHNLTANNKRPIQGLTVAAPRNIPLGTKLLIEQYIYEVQDRYNKHLSDRIDIYFTNHLEAKKFGVKHLTVTIITKTNH